ncbi:MAG: hypothetical protein WCP24_03600 [bacterium]
MSTYTTQYLKSFSADKPFVFEVTEKALELLELQKRNVKAGRAPLLGHSVEELVRNFEFSLFPSFKDVLEISFENGFSFDLITKILCDFGADESLIQELIRNKDFVLPIKPWFSGIIGDGGRAIRTMDLVYSRALKCWKSGAIEVSCHEVQGQAGLIGDVKAIQA